MAYPARFRGRVLRTVVGVAVVMASCGGLAAATDLRSPGAPWVTPLEIDFGPVAVGSTSAELTVTITNTGTDLLTDFAGGGVASPFSAGTSCAGGVAAGASCVYVFSFSPVTAGTFTATSRSTTSAGPITIVMHGKGVGPELHVTPLALDFGSVYNGWSAPQQTVTVRNTGLATLAGFTGGGVPPPFSGSQNCAGGVPPGASCQYFFNFSPTESGAFTATSNTGTDAGPFSIAMNGRGRSILFGSGQRVTPRSIDFGPVAVGGTSGSHVVEVTNQNASGAITGFVGGGVGQPFSASQNCVPEVSAGDSCQFFYRFSPTAPGAFTATSTVTDSAGTFSIELRGEGVGAVLLVTPLVLDFGPVPVGQVGAPQSVTMTNVGMADLEGFAGGGVSAPFSGSQNCAPSVAPGQSCQLTFSFAPTATGLLTTTSMMSTDAGPISIRLIGGEIVTIFRDDFESGGTTGWSSAVP